MTCPAGKQLDVAVSENSVENYWLTDPDVLMNPRVDDSHLMPHHIRLLSQEIRDHLPPAAWDYINAEKAQALSLEAVTLMPLDGLEEADTQLLRQIDSFAEKEEMYPLLDEATVRKLRRVHWAPQIHTVQWIRRVRSLEEEAVARLTLPELLQYLEADSCTSTHQKSPRDRPANPQSRVRKAARRLHKRFSPIRRKRLMSMGTKNLPNRQKKTSKNPWSCRNLVVSSSESSFDVVSKSAAGLTRTATEFVWSTTSDTTDQDLFEDP